MNKIALHGQPAPNWLLGASGASYAKVSRLEGMCKLAQAFTHMVVLSKLKIGYGLCPRCQAIAWTPPPPISRTEGYLKLLHPLAEGPSQCQAKFGKRASRLAPLKESKHAEQAEQASQPAKGNKGLFELLAVEA